MSLYFLPLVDWGMGTVLIGVFALVCIVLIAIVINLTRSTETVKDVVKPTLEEPDTKDSAV